VRVPATLRALRIAVAAGAMLVVLAACSATATQAPSIAQSTATPAPSIAQSTANPAPSVARATPATGGNAVTIDNFAFGPSSLTVAVGTKVTWTNKDSDAHTVTADDGSFDSGALGEGATFSQTFSKAGTYAYHCKIHSFMTATIVVQ
jgi:plastocyanin